MKRFLNLVNPLFSFAAVAIKLRLRRRSETITKPYRPRKGARSDFSDCIDDPCIGKPFLFQPKPLAMDIISQLDE